ncbi:MAG: hypothetical protein H6680_08110 [Desulfobacteraceae bacterium]|nr:hypothetical protein [Desulfobacteraceae bacterium]
MTSYDFMKRFKVFLWSFLLVYLFIGKVNAASYDFDMGADSSIDVSGTADFLELYANINPNLSDMAFSLEEGSSSTFYLATIGTHENWVNNDDIKEGLIKAYLDFDSPELIQAVGGTSIGFSGGIFFNKSGFHQGWSVEWEQPVYVNFGLDGLFSINLNNLFFESFCWQGPDGSMCNLFDNLEETQTHMFTKFPFSQSRKKKLKYEVFVELK